MLFLFSAYCDMLPFACQRLDKRVSAATDTKAAMQDMVIGGVFCAVRAEVMYREPEGELNYDAHT
jgi:hypothetical protein